MRLVIATMTCALAASCAPYSSYPPIEKTAAITDLSFEPVPTVITTSIEWARSREKGAVAEQPLAFTLPVGSPEPAYALIEERIAGAVRADPGTPAIGVKSVRVRGFDATVDITIPRDDQEPLLYTVTLKSMPFKSWKVIGERRWRFSPKSLARMNAGLGGGGDEDLAEAGQE